MRLKPALVPVAWAASHLPVVGDGFSALGPFFDVVGFAFVGGGSTSWILAIPISGNQSSSSGAGEESSLSRQVEVEIVRLEDHPTKIAKFEEVDSDGGGDW